MALHPIESSLPTISKLGNPTIPDDVDPAQIASEWLLSFSKFAEKGDVDGVLSLLIKSSFEFRLFESDGEDDSWRTKVDQSSEVSVYWRDMLALTWDFRTFEGTPKIDKFLSDRLPGAKIANVQLKTDFPPILSRAAPDLIWIMFMFTFETDVGVCSGIVRLVPISGPNGDITIWKAHTVYTNLDGLKGVDEKVGLQRDHEPNHGKWEDARRKETSFEGKDPSVLIIGAGQSGLNVGAHLKVLGVPTLIIEKNARIGDNWRTRYEALCLHDAVCELSIFISLRVGFL